MANDNIFSGLKVVDLASFIAGPGAAVILSDYGADVANGFLNEMSAQKIATQYQQFPYANADFGAVVDKALTADAQSQGHHAG